MRVVCIEFEFLKIIEKITEHGDFNLYRSNKKLVRKTTKCVDLCEIQHTVYSIYYNITDSIIVRDTTNVHSL